MSDTTAYLAGCATTGVAALVLLVARIGMVSANPDGDRARQLGDRPDQIEVTTPGAGSGSEAIAGTQANQQVQYEIRRELDKQRDLTEKLEDQLAQQETLSGSLETQLKAQEVKTQELLVKIQDYQQSVESLELQDKITAATRPADAVASPSGPPTSVIWLGAGVVIVLILGGGGLILCAVLLILQSQRRSARPGPMPPLPMPPAAYRYYDQTFLPPPAQYRNQRSYYDRPPSPYDYTP